MQDSPDIGKVVLIGPCGLQRGVPASFTPDLADALRHRHPSTHVLIAAATAGESRPQPPAIFCTELFVEEKKAYTDNARYLSSPALGIDVVCLQHHYELYGGKDGEFILAFLDRLAIPVVTTLHQVPANPSRHLAQTTARLLEQSDRVVVTNPADCETLETAFGADSHRIDIIPQPATPYRLRDRVTAEMAEPRHRPPAGRRKAGTPLGTPQDELAWDWDTVAELYNHSLVKAIIGTRPAKRDQRTQPWPWMHRREFAVSSGPTPGWDD
jgi:hypothetical protein